MPSDFAEIARINHQHSAANPYSQFRTVYTLAQIESSPMVHAPLTKLQCCPTSDGAAAAVLCSADFLNSLPDPQAAWAKAVRIVGMRLATDGPSVFSRSAIDLVGFGMTSSAARAALAEAGLLKSQDVDNDEEFRKAARKCAVVELHDCFSANELITLDALGLADAGKAHLLVREGGITYPRLRGDRAVVNPSGGLISKGHPLGATGIAQAAELVWHLRGWATNRAVGSDGGGRVRYALQHNLGLGGAVVVAVYERADGKSAPTTEEVGGDDGVAKVSGVGYNPATEARGFTPEQARSVMSSTKSSAWASGDDERRRLESRI